ncbi:sigma 54-interacting transcriptional regulator [Alkalibacter saccharofermentans]|uniref:Transcriptional regulator containing an AAA-type ATPase domain and a DNA-binding domain n=1 Tax=Alkalibacter saccharofermentans DSM 14828 TaxID=1120975 RepID=A0A1M4U2H5_9FIRM|nr:sigma 54-interacting transcriptional regulator [Alkalibacter saccharofermentans]SHE50959.1 Transcriptional regulator containing an AAA-type ATPase domain and a DNA-binding domain [Alkalibacter saccharofermentans DSM 14828]
MKEKLLQLIENEDKKNPYTDSQLSKMLGMTRSNVTILRKKLNIDDSRIRRMGLLVSDISSMMRSQSSIITITEKLKEKGYEISKNSVAQIISEHNLRGNLHENIQPKVKQESTNYEEVSVKNKGSGNVFESIIGWNGSLRNKVEQAKAAVLYPPNGLHTLIIGATGVGKSHMAEVMHKFALIVRDKRAESLPFVVFNCADYSENPQLLLSQLFGYVKGAFTGAVEDKAGLVDSASGGILFLDEVHRLPSEGQEILFQLIDKGHYRRLGDTNITRRADVMIIAATSEDIETNLLTTFRRRIPMVIELPKLEERDLDEKYDIIINFFRNEAQRIKKPLLITRNVLRDLLFYKCTGNIGQLRSDVQVVCARGLLSYITTGSTEEAITIDTEFLPSHVIQDTSYNKTSRAEIERIVHRDITIDIDYEDTEFKAQENSAYDFQENIYKDIENQYIYYKEQGCKDEDIEEVISENLENKIKDMIDIINANKYKYKKVDIESIVGKKVVDTVQKMMKIAQEEIDHIDDTLYYCLATHINATINRIRNGQKIFNPKLDYVRDHYIIEYALAEKMIEEVKNNYAIDIPEEEIAFIAMYISNYTKNSDRATNKVGVVIMTHGSIASGMANVANTLLGVDHVRSVEMSLDEKPEEAFERALNAVVEADSGKGVLILVDMGSLETFGNRITRKTGVRTLTVGRVDTLMALDATRMALLPEANLSYISKVLQEDKMIMVGENNQGIDRINSKKESIVVTICFTGEGMAKTLGEMITKEIESFGKKIKVISMRLIDSKKIEERIKELKNKYNLLAIVGTVNVYEPGVAFAYASDILKEEGLKSFADAIRQKIYDLEYVDDSGVAESLFKEEIIYMNKEIATKDEAIKFMCSDMLIKGYINESYLDGVLQRESMCPTFTENLLAIPHGYCEDVIKPGVGIMIPKDPVDWGNGRFVSIILLLALNDEAKDEFQWIYKIITDREIVKKIKNQNSSRKIVEIFNSKRKEFV